MLSGTDLSELEPVRQALSQGRYEAAFALLERAASRPRRRRVRALYRLHLAALYALYGEDGLDAGSEALESAYQADPSVAELPLYLALHWEFEALDGTDGDEVREGVAQVEVEQDPEALYHAASALYSAGAYEESVALLARGDAERGPGYLRWRHWSLLGVAQEDLGRFAEAAEAFRKSVELAAGADQQLERLALANSLLELIRGDEALAVLAGVDFELLELDEDRSQYHYLLGRAEFARGNPNHAAEHFDRAYDGLPPDTEAAYPLLVAHGQALAALGRFAESAERFEEAMQCGNEDGRSYARHELALTILDMGEIEAAREQLDLVVADEQYSYRADALADLADAHFKAGDFDRAQELAQEAMEAGAAAAASLTMGSVAFEYFRLEEALTWFERAASAGEPGDPIWVLSQQLLADVCSQLGPDWAHRLVTHAQAALEHTDPGSEWYLPLQEHLKRAETQLGGHRRVLN